MRIQIEATEFLTELDGVPVRLWEGTTESGIACKVFVHRVVVDRDNDCAAFEAELREMAPPAGTPVRIIPLSHLLP